MVARERRSGGRSGGASSQRMLPTTGGLVERSGTSSRTSFLGRLSVFQSRAVSVVPYAPERLSITQDSMTPTMQEALAHAGIDVEKHRGSQNDQTNTLFAALRMRRALQRSKAGRITSEDEVLLDEMQANVTRHAKVLERYKIRRVDNEEHDDFCVHGKSRLLVNPHSLLFKLWQLMTLVLIIYQSLALPYALAFDTNDSAWFDYFTTGVFAFDILVQLNTPIASAHDDSVYIADRCQIAKHYARGWLFFDLLASVPFDEIVLLTRGVDSDDSSSKNNLNVLGLLKVLRVPRLLRLFRLIRVVKILRIRPELRRWLQYSRHANLLRLLRLVTTFLVINHLLACIWHGAVATHEPLSDTGDKRSQWHYYIVSYYTSLLLVMGQNIDIQSDAEYIFSILVLLFGAVVMAVVFGNVAMLIANYYENQSSHQKKMESLFASMNRMKLPHELQNRINDYYQAMWERHGTLDGAVTSFIPELSRNLAYEVELFLRMDMINRAPIFQNCSAKVVQELVMELDLQVFMPGDYIVVRGEVGNDMYFVQSGVCEVTKDVTTNQSFTSPTNNSAEVDLATNEIILKTLGQGDYFGEIALLMYCKRTANVRARVFSELCTLTREVFESISLRYLEDRNIIEKFIMDKYDPGMLQAAMKQSQELTNRSTGIPAGRPSVVENQCENKTIDLLRRIDERLWRLETKMNRDGRENTDSEYHTQHSINDSRDLDQSMRSVRKVAASRTNNVMAFEPEHVSQRNLFSVDAHRRSAARTEIEAMTQTLETDDGQATEERPNEAKGRRAMLQRNTSWRNTRRDGSMESFRLRKLVKGPSTAAVRRQSSRASSLTAAITASQPVPVSHSKYATTPRGSSNLHPSEGDDMAYLTTDSLDHLADVLAQHEKHDEVDH